MNYYFYRLLLNVIYLLILKYIMYVKCMKYVNKTYVNSLDLVYFNVLLLLLHL